MSALVQSVLALDLATKTGWACSDGQSGVADFSGHMGHGHLAWRFAGWLGDKLIETGAEIVVIEGLAGHYRGEANRVMPGLRFLALAACWGHERVHEEIPQAQWKAWARKHLPDWVKGDEADARALLAYWLAVRAPKVEAA